MSLEKGSDLVPKRTKEKADNEQEPTIVTSVTGYFPFLNLA